MFPFIKFLLLLLSSSSLLATNFEHASLAGNPVFDKEFGILKRKIDRADGQFGIAEYLRASRINRARDRGQDLALTQALESEYALANQDLVQELLDTLRIGHNRQLLETVSYVGIETAMTEESVNRLNFYNEIVNSKYYYFTPEHKKNARLFINGSPEVNAYSFTGYPQTVYNLGLIESQSKEGFRSVVGHELGHAVSAHFDHRVEAYAYLLLGGYYMFDDSSKTYRLNAESNSLLSSFEKNIGLMSSINPKAVANSQLLNPMEKAAVLMFADHFKSLSPDSYQKTMELYLSTISSLANRIFVRAQTTGAFAQLENLIYRIESVFIDEQRMAEKIDQTIAKQAKLGSPSSKHRDLSTSVKVFYEQLQYGLMSLSRSHERTADHYGVLLAGEQATKEVLSHFMAGKISNIDEQVAQRKVIEKDEKQEPSRHKAELDSWYLTHPTPLRRLENAQKFVSSLQYRTLTNDFYIAYADLLDMLYVYGQSEDKLAKSKTTDKETLDKFKALEAQYNNILKYLQGKIDTAPEGIDFGDTLATEESKNILIEQIKLNLRQVKIDRAQYISAAKEEMGDFLALVPEMESYTKRFSALVKKQIVKLSKSLSPEQFNIIVEDFIAMFGNWIEQSPDQVEAKSFFNELGLIGLVEKLEKTNPQASKKMTNGFTKIIAEYYKNSVAPLTDQAPATAKIGAEKINHSKNSLKMITAQVKRSCNISF